MKYVVAGKDLNKGKMGDDGFDSGHYFELGWEVMTTHLMVKKMLRTGEISGDDTIVTAAGREFLYGRQFRRVIEYSDFLSRPDQGREVIDLVPLCVRQFETGEMEELYLRHGRYKYFDQDYEVITDLDFCDVGRLVANLEKYCCVAIRYRDHMPQRNLKPRFFGRLLRRLSREYQRIFVVGHGSEKFTNHHVVQVNLREWASLVNHCKCDFVLGTLTGPIILCQLACRPQTRIYIIDVQGHHQCCNYRHPLMFGSSVQFKGDLQYVWEGRIPRVKEVLNRLCSSELASK